MCRGEVNPDLYLTPYAKANAAWTTDPDVRHRHKAAAMTGNNFVTLAQVESPWTECKKPYIATKK